MTPSDKTGNGADPPALEEDPVFVVPVTVDGKRTERSYECRPTIPTGVTWDYLRAAGAIATRKTPQQRTAAAAGLFAATLDFLESALTPEAWQEFQDLIHDDSGAVIDAGEMMVAAQQVISVYSARPT